MDSFSVFPILAIAGYILGSIPFGLLLCKMAGLGDIRKIGSGNIGATNVLRTGNKLLAALTLFLDGGKGAIAAIVAGMLWEVDGAIVAGFGAVLGHIFPVWLKFKGGKGIATTLGTLITAVPLAGLISCAIWLGAAFMFRISSLASLFSMILAPVLTLAIYGKFPASITLLITAVVVIRHKDNILRLLKKEEPKIGSKTKKDTQ